MGWLEKGTEAPSCRGMGLISICPPPWEHYSLFNGQTSSTSRELHTCEAPRLWHLPDHSRSGQKGWWWPCGDLLTALNPPSLSHTQLDKLRTIIENMLASSSTLLSMSLNMAPHKPP